MPSRIVFIVVGLAAIINAGASVNGWLRYAEREQISQPGAWLLALGGGLLILVSLFGLVWLVKVLVGA